ncbi:MarR family winged helix-turn-helix transcriptional regulator [Rhizobium helianthi]|uniref:MarR family winged helix-turn-helix transcriptional regulator n=1 Tax=Rhizobium helianthi TaxID=1132695 RepID=A0ABW4M6U7_9HYPH
MSKKKNDKKDKSGKRKDIPAQEDLAPALTSAARSLRTVLSRNLAEAGLYAGQDGVILHLSRGEALTPGQLAQRLGVKAPTMTRTVGRMEAQGFVQRKADGTDGRLIKVHLTPAGLETVARIHAAAAASAEQALEGFSAKEVRTLLKLLKAVDRNLSGMDPPDDEDVDMTNG